MFTPVRSDLCKRISQSDRNIQRSSYTYSKIRFCVDAFSMTNAIHYLLSVEPQHKVELTDRINEKQSYAAGRCYPVFLSGVVSCGRTGVSVSVVVAEGFTPTSSHAFSRAGTNCV